MKTSLLLGLAAIFYCASVVADIPPPPPNRTTITVQGADARELSNGLRAAIYVEFSLRTGTGYYQVFRSTAGTTQTVCTFMVSRLNNTRSGDTCVITHSGNGQPVPLYVPRRIMG